MKNLHKKENQVNGKRHRKTKNTGSAIHSVYVLNLCKIIDYFNIKDITFYFSIIYLRTFMQTF